MYYLILFFCFASSLFAEPIFIGIAGGTGSGKTTLAERIHQALPDSILIYQDAYYKDLSHLPEEVRKATNFDHPNSLDFSLLAEHLKALKRGEAIDVSFRIAEGKIGLCSLQGLF